mgnify:CR=1 FL=1
MYYATDKSIKDLTYVPLLGSTAPNTQASKAQLILCGQGIRHIIEDYLDDFQATLLDLYLQNADLRALYQKHSSWILITFNIIKL